MTVYQALQLNAAGSKAAVRNAESSREKLRLTAIYILKVFLTVAFCMAVVSVFSALFGEENSTAGVVLLLFILTFRQTDFGIRAFHGALAMLMIFAFMLIGPHLSNMLGPLPAFFTDTGCLLAILVLGCHNVIMYNQLILVLSYFMLQGYDVSGHAFYLRSAGLICGALFTALMYYAVHRKRHYKRTLLQLLGEFRLSASRSRWQLKMALGLSLCLLTARLLSLPRGMWIAFAAMSILLPFEKDGHYRIKRRVPFNIIGSIVFAAIYTVLPPSFIPYIGLIGGIGVGFSASYMWQTIFNTFGALNMAAAAFGLGNAVFLRILTNIIGCLIAVFFGRFFDALCSKTRKALEFS